MTDKKRNIIHLLEHSILLMFCFSVLRGEIIALGGYIDTEDDENHGNHAVAVDDRNIVHGYINAYTKIKITVILTQEHTALLWNPFVTYLGFATEGSLPVTDFINNMEIDDFFDELHTTFSGSEKIAMILYPRLKKILEYEKN